MKLRIYTDTSVIGGCLDEEFNISSRRLLEAFTEGELILVLSELTLHELAAGPDKVRAVIDNVPQSHVEILGLTPEITDLAAAYIEDGAIGPRMRTDALHIAIATVSRVDVLVSWNFKHIVNLKRIHAYNAVNLKQGYPLLEIRTPREIFNDE